MADHYTQFSFSVGPDIFPPVAIDYALKLHDRLQELSGTDPQEEQGGDSLTIKAQDLLAQMDGYANFRAEAMNELWIYSDDTGTVEHAALFLQAVLEEHNLDEAVGFTWANTCNKPRINAFSGGAVVVTRNEIQWDDADWWLQKTLQTHRQPVNPLLTAAKALLESLQTPEQLQQVYWEYRDNLQKAVAAAETEALQQRYLAAKGVRCPACGEIHIEGRGNWNVEENIATQSMSCTRCDLAWVDVYTLSGMVNLEVPHE